MAGREWGSPRGGGPGKELPVKDTACWCSPCPTSQTPSDGMVEPRVGTGTTERGRGVWTRGPGWAGARQTPYPAALRLGFLHWKMGRSPGPSPGRVATTPGLIRPWSPPLPWGDRAPERPQVSDVATRPQVPAARAPLRGGACAGPAPRPQLRPARPRPSCGA